MTRVHHRHLRVVWDGAKKDKQWVVQSCVTTDPQHTWQDILRFATPDKAVRYIEEINGRDRALYEAYR